MFKLLQRKSSINFVLLPVVMLLLWGSNLLHPQFVMHYYDTNPMVLYRPLLAVQQWNAYVGQILSILIVGANMLLLAKINTSLRLIEKRTVFNIFLFIVFSASLQEFKQLNPMQPALFFIILGIVSLYKMYKNERELRTVFEASVCFSIASLFYAQAIYFMLLVPIGLCIFVSFYWRQWLSAIVGCVLPLLLLFMLAFCFDALPAQIEVWKENLVSIQSVTTIRTFPLLFTVYLALLFLISLLYAYSGGLKKVSIKKYYLLLLLFMLYIVAMAIFVPFVSSEILFFGLLPAAIFISNYMVNLRRSVLAEVLFIIIVVFVVLAQVFPDVSSWLL